jgi:hypothetical protein
MEVLDAQRLERAAQAAARALASNDPKVRAGQFSPVDEKPGKSAKSA